MVGKRLAKMRALFLTDASSQPAELKPHAQQCAWGFFMAEIWSGSAKNTSVSAAFEGGLFLPLAQFFRSRPQGLNAHVGPSEEGMRASQCRVLFLLFRETDPGDKSRFNRVFSIHGVA